MWLCERDGVVAVSGVFNNALSRGCSSPFNGSAYKPSIRKCFYQEIVPDWSPSKRPGIMERSRGIPPSTSMSILGGCC